MTRRPASGSSSFPFFPARPLLVTALLALQGCSAMDPTLGGVLKVQTSGDAPAVHGSATTRAVGLPAPVIPVPAAAPGSSNAAWPAARGCRTVSQYAVKADVDTLYARAMKAFDFKSPEQIAAIRKTVDRLYVVDEGYVHEKQSGSYYHLAQSVGYVLPSAGRDAMWLDLEFSKNGSGSLVDIKYCTTSRDPKVGTVQFHEDVQRLIKKAVGL